MAATPEESRRWREKNPDYHREYYQKNRAMSSLQSRLRREALSEEEKARRRAANKERQRSISPEKRKEYEDRRKEKNAKRNEMMRDMGCESVSQWRAQPDASSESE